MKPDPRILLILMGILAALILAEVGARLVGPPEELREAEKMLRCDRWVGWRGKANFTATVDLNGYEHRVGRNSWGMHDKEHARQKDDRVFRILMLGDSYVEAIEVEEDQTSQAILEETLTALAPPGVRFEVISGAIHGWGPIQELMYFRTEGRSFQPDLILVFWAPANDLANVLPYQVLTVDGVNCYAPYFAFCEGQFDPDPFFAIPGKAPALQSCSTGAKFFSAVVSQLYAHSRLFQRLTPLLAHEQDRLSFSHRFAPWLVDQAADGILNDAYRLTIQIYQQLAAEGEQIGAKTLFIVVPFNQAVYSEVYPQLAAALEQDLPGFEAANPTWPNQTFAQQMQAKDLPVFDLHPYFVQHLRESGQDLHWPGDIHWNLAGNRFVSEVIAAWLIEQGFAPAAR